MAENQLREAYALMKQGKKTEAAQIVQAVLREDKRNLNAWWLLSLVLEDEDKIVKALENVLTLSPEHLGARKRLAALRPEYAHLHENGDKAKQGQYSDAYFERADNPTKVRQARNGAVSGELRLYFIMPFLIFGVVLGIGLFGFMADIAKTDFPEEGEVNAAILADMPNNPEAVTRAFLEAFHKQSTETLYAVTCPAFHPEVDEMDADFDDPWAWQNVVDFSDTSFVLDTRVSNDSYAYVALHGVTKIDNGTTHIQSDWDAMAASEGYNAWGYNLQKINGQWLVCPNN